MNCKALVKRLMIVDDVERAFPFDHQLSCTIINYHQLSFSLSLFKFFMIVDDSFSRLTMRTIVHDSSSVSCFGNFGQIAVRKHVAALSRRKNSYFYKFVLREAI